MALEVASILDELALQPEWIDKSCSTLNTKLNAIKVKPNYSIMVTIAGRNYYLVSDQKGVLSVAALASGPQSTKALATCKCRLVIAADALDTFDAANVTTMLAKRHMWYEGDTSLLNNLSSDLAPHLDGLRNAVEAGGPGASVIKAAIDEHNMKLEESKFDLAEYAGSMDLGLQPGDDQPVILKCGSWMMFSASTTMFGNTGQSNYCAANNLLDAHTFSYRQTNYDSFEALTLMWGAVVGLGMRWKAFASQDFLTADQTMAAMTFTWQEAQSVLKYMIITNTEWVTIARGVGGQSAMTMFGNNARHPDPWQFKKGKGGGLTVATSDAIDVDPLPERKSPAAKDEQQEELYPGRRIRVQGLVHSPEMNDVKGTLVEEVRPGVWHVTLDDGLGEKLLKEENMAQVHSSRFQTAKEPSRPTEATVESPPEPMCIAGNWDSWMPQDMQWDDVKKCYTFNVLLSSHTTALFGVNRGVAGTKPWKSGSFKKWNMGQANGPHQIKVFVKDSKVSAAEWAPCPQAIASS